MACEDCTWRDPCALHTDRDDTRISTAEWIRDHE